MGNTVPSNLDDTGELSLENQQGKLYDNRKAFANATNLNSAVHCFCYSCFF